MVKDKDYFFATLFNFLKSTQIFNFPFFLSIAIIGDNHVASSTSWMNIIVNSLSISCLTIAT